MREIVGLRQLSRPADLDLETKETWKKLAEKMYELKSKEFDENVSAVERIFRENVGLLKPLLGRCPVFARILAHILLNKMGFRAQDVDWTSEMVDWREEESKRVGQSSALFLRKRKTGEVAVDAWRKQYSQLEILFEEVCSEQSLARSEATSCSNTRRGNY